MSKVDYDYLFKFLLIGNNSVGKSELLCRFAGNVWEDGFVSAIGVDFVRYYFKSNIEINNYRC